MRTQRKKLPTSCPHTCSAGLLIYSLSSLVVRERDAHTFRYNTQSNKMLGPEQLSQEKRDSSMAADHGRNLRSERKALTVTVNATDPFPEAPSQVAVDDVDMR